MGRFLIVLVFMTSAMGLITAAEMHKKYTRYSPWLFQSYEPASLIRRYGLHVVLLISSHRPPLLTC
jgi:hypothetical protein